MRLCDSLVKVFFGVSDSETERLLIEKLEQLGGKVEQGVTFVDFVEETDGLLARLRTDAGERRLIWRNETPCLFRSPTYPGTFST